MGFAVKYAQIERQQEKNECQKTNPNKNHSFLRYSSCLVKVGMEASAFNSFCGVLCLRVLPARPRRIKIAGGVAALFA